MPALSIIVPVYKVEPYLRRCVDSILVQTFTDFELILVDDGSPDNCPAICDEYAESDSRIIVIHKENGGLSDARNAGLDIAKGDYIGFVDSDDWIHPQMYEILMHLMVSKNVDMVKCECLWTKKTEVDFEPMDLEELEKNAQILYRQDYIDNFYPENRRIIRDMAVNKLYKRETFSNIRYPKGRIYEDSYVLLDVLDTTNSIAAIDSFLYFYYQREDSIIGAPFSAWREKERMSMWERYCDFFDKKGNKVQKNYVLEDYIPGFCRQKIKIWVKYPKDKKAFKPAQKAFNAQMPDMLRLASMCNMKRIMLICVRFCPKIAYKIARRYFPEILEENMR